MTITVTLFHGILGWTAGCMALGAIVSVVLAARDWATERVGTGCPRRLVLRWDRPGARVLLRDGRQARILRVAEHDQAGRMYAVHGYGEDDRPEWASRSQAAPLAAAEREVAR